MGPGSASITARPTGRAVRPKKSTAVLFAVRSTRNRGPFFEATIMDDETLQDIESQNLAFAAIAETYQLKPCIKCRTLQKDLHDLISEIRRLKALLEK